MNEKTIETNLEEETFNLGKTIGEKVKPSTVICLDGDLGVGKTVFAKGLAKGLGIDEAVSSPTFTIIHEYKTGRLPFYHLDVYRILDISEMDELGADEYFYGDGVCLIEWATNIEEILPESAIRITINKDLNKGDNYRRITIKNISK